MSRLGLVRIADDVLGIAFLLGNRFPLDARWEGSATAATYARSYDGFDGGAAARANRSRESSIAARVEVAIEIGWIGCTDPGGDESMSPTGS